MARAKWCGSEIYDVAAAFKERCLVGNDSLFAPGSGVWTPEHVLSVRERVGVEDLGSGSFIEKLEAQVDGLAPAEIQVGRRTSLHAPPARGVRGRHRPRGGREMGVPTHPEEARDVFALLGAARVRLWQEEHVEKFGADLDLGRRESRRPGLRASL